MTERLESGSFPTYPQRSHQTGWSATKNFGGMNRALGQVGPQTLPRAHVPVGYAALARQPLSLFTLTCEHNTASRNGYHPTHSPKYGLLKLAGRRRPTHVTTPVSHVPGGGNVPDMSLSLKSHDYGAEKEAKASLRAG